jgi:glutathione S-transferase
LHASRFGYVEADIFASGIGTLRAESVSWQLFGAMMLTAWWQQPWAKQGALFPQGIVSRRTAMITLYVFGPYFGLPDPSAYVIKTETQLKMAGLSYRTDPTGFPKAPKGKLPYIEDDGEIIPDSTFIRAHIERKYRVDLDAGLDPRRRAEAWAIERLLEDHLGWAAGHARWLIPENFEKGPAHFFDTAPEAVRTKLREDARLRVHEAMRAHGIGRHSPEEIVQLGVRSLAALSTLLGDKAYLMGDRPSGVDATGLGMLASILTPFFDSPLRRRAEGFPNLRLYVDRLMWQYYPGHSWQHAEKRTASALVGTA